MQWILYFFVEFQYLGIWISQILWISIFRLTGTKGPVSSLLK